MEVTEGEEMETNCASHISTGLRLYPVQMPHICTEYLAWCKCDLYRMHCIGSIPGTNEGYEQVQIPVFPVVQVALPVLVDAFAGAM
jgi:hypothetical protein